MSDSHSESLPKATIWSLKLHCMDNLLLCTRKKEKENSLKRVLLIGPYIFFGRYHYLKFIWLRFMKNTEISMRDKGYPLCFNTSVLYVSVWRILHALFFGNIIHRAELSLGVLVKNTCNHLEPHTWSKVFRRPGISLFHIQLEKKQMRI